MLRLERTKKALGRVELLSVGTTCQSNWLLSLLETRTRPAGQAEPRGSACALVSTYSHNRRGTLHCGIPDTPPRSRNG